MLEIPAWYRWAAVAGVFGLAAFLVWNYGDNRFEAGIKHEQDARAKQVIDEMTSNRKLEIDVGKDKDENFDKYVQARDLALGDAAAARSELERLRNTLSRYSRTTGQGTQTERGSDETASLAESLQACAGRHQGVADDGQQDAEQVIGLQDYIRAIAPICLDKEN